MLGRAPVQDEGVVLVLRTPYYDVFFYRRCAPCDVAVVPLPRRLLRTPYDVLVIVPLVLPTPSFPFRHARMQPSLFHHDLPYLFNKATQTGVSNPLADPSRRFHDRPLDLRERALFTEAEATERFEGTYGCLLPGIDR